MLLSVILHLLVKLCQYVGPINFICERQLLYLLNVRVKKGKNQAKTGPSHKIINLSGD